MNRKTGWHKIVGGGLAAGLAMLLAVGCDRSPPEWEPQAEPAVPEPAPQGIPEQPVEPEQPAEQPVFEFD